MSGFKLCSGGHLEHRSICGWGQRRMEGSERSQAVQAGDTLNIVEVQLDLASQRAACGVEESARQMAGARHLERFLRSNSISAAEQHPCTESRQTPAAARPQAQPLRDPFIQEAAASCFASS